MIRLLKNLIELLFPRTCIACSNKLMEQESHLCVQCLLELPRTHHATLRDNPMERIFEGRVPLQRAMAFCYFSKGNSLQNIMHGLKYENRPDIGIFMGNLAVEHGENKTFFEGIDLLVPVPLHRKKLKKRGYNQALSIAEGISQATGIPIDSSNLIRKINNPSQTKLGKGERWQNVSDIFAINSTQAFENKHIMLIDDVFTTGATIEACIRPLLHIQGIKVSIFTLAMAMRD